MAKASSLLWCLCAVSVCHGWTRLEAQPRVLTRTAIEDAIAFGATREPSPYLLRHGGREDNQMVVGAVYTPFLRVAFLSHAAWQRGEMLEPAEVDTVLTEPLAYIAFRWSGAFDQIDLDRVDEFAAQQPRVAMLQDPAPSIEKSFAPFSTIRAGVRPVWVKPADQVLDTFGAPLPYDDVVFVAACPLDSLTTLRRFVIYKALFTDDDVPAYIAERWGVVRAADVARWR